MALENPDEQLGSILLDNSLGTEIISYLRIPDVMKLTCASNAIYGWIKDQESQNSEFRALLKWLKDVEVLIMLRCPHTLFRKMASALRHPSQCRIVCSVDHDDPDTVYDSLSDLYALNNDKLFGVLESFERIDDDMAISFGFPYWEEFGIASANDGDGEEEDGDVGRVANHTRKNCCSRGCARSRRLLVRPFVVNDKFFCGACLDDDVYLRILFGSEHSIGFSNCSDWCPVEKDCQTSHLSSSESDVSQPRGPGDFSVQLWEHYGLLLERFWFIGKGERDSTVNYSEPQLDAAGNEAFVGRSKKRTHDST